METSWVILTVALVTGMGIVSPGRDYLVISCAALSRPRGEAVAVALGVVAGTGVWAGVALLALGGLYSLAPALYLPIRLAGALYLVWLGFQLLRYARRPLSSGSDVPATHSWRSAWTRGLAASLSNPRAALYFASVLASAAPANADWNLLGLMVATVVLVAALWDLAIVHALAHPQMSVTVGRTKQLVESGFGLLLVGFALRQLVML